jgi:hypothetical protein
MTVGSFVISVSRAGKEKGNENKEEVGSVVQYATGKATWARGGAFGAGSQCVHTTGTVGLAGDRPKTAGSNLPTGLGRHYAHQARQRV